MWKKNKDDDHSQNSSFLKLEKAWKKITGQKRSKHRIVLVNKFCRPLPEISFDTRKWRQYLVISLIGMFVVSFIFEWRRLYQEQVAKKASASIAGMPLSCLGDSLSWQGVKSMFRFYFSWSADPCEKYHQAMLVDAFFEINPVMVLGSLVARTIVHPMEIFASGISRSTRNLFSEIPVQWQILFFALIFVVIVISLLGYFGYKISIPFVLSIEPVGRSQRTETTNKKYQ